MSIFTALTNSVTGLRAQSYALENISDNIANSQTTGYKRVDTSFMDMVADAPLRQQTGGAVTSFSRATNTIGGAVTNSGVATNFALDGNGFVAVRQRMDAGTDLPTFSQMNLYTRRGDFSVDKQGFLVNGAGNYLLGTPVDPATGQVTGTALEVVRVAVNAIPPRATTNFTYRATIPSTPATANYDAAIAGSDIWAAGAASPALVTPASAPSSQSFAANSISGSTGRFYNALGTPVDVDFRWAKLGAPTAAGDTTWGLYFNSAPGANASTFSWTLASNVTFNNAGVATNPNGVIQIDMAARGLETVSVDLANGLGQYHLDSRQMDLAEFSQDGYSAGELDSVYVSGAGMVTGSFTNGRTQPLAQIAIAQFNAPDMLKRQSGSAFAETIESGMPLMNATGTNLISGSLEGSNTDIAEEFSRMIVTQQAYSANTRVMSTAQDMLRDVMNILR